MRLIGAALFIWVIAASASAQTPNPVREHYRAYQAAIEANDLPAADRAGAAALEASEARDGGGGSTGVLAFNLAVLRLEMGRRNEALAPAQRAHALAGEGAAGVDPQLAALVLGRAELGQRDADGSQRLFAAFETSDPAHAVALFDAASDLGRWGMENNRFEVAQRAWTAAAAFAARLEAGQAPLEEARARLGLGASYMLDTRNYDPTRASLGGTRITRDQDEALQLDTSAHGEFERAMELMRPLASRQAQNAAMTVAQGVYAQAYAWRSALRARMRARDFSLPRASGEGISLATRAGASPCQMDIRAEPMPRFPAEQLMRYGVGSVVMRYVTDEAGQVLEQRVVAAVGNNDFIRAVEAVAPRWRVESAQGQGQCNLAMVFFQAVTFHVE